MQPQDPSSSHESTDSYARRRSPAPQPSKPTDPDVLSALSQRLLDLAQHSRLGSRDGKSLLREIEQIPNHEERCSVINSTLTSGLPGRGVLALHRSRMSEELLHKLITLGLDVTQTFPIKVVRRGIFSETIQGGNVYHLAAVEGDHALLKILPHPPELLNSRTATGETPLLLAFKYSADTKAVKETLRLLSSWGADLAARDDAKREVFHYSFQYPGAHLLDALVKCWKERDILPISRYEAQSGLAMALMGPHPASRRSVQCIKQILGSFSGDNSSPQGEVVFELLQCIDDLLPRTSDSTDHADYAKKLKQNSEARRVLERSPLSRPDPEKVLACNFTFNKVLGQWAAYKDVLGSDLVKYMTESTLPTRNLPLLPAAYEARIPVHTLCSIADLGADITFRFDTNGIGADSVRHGTVLHHALANLQYERADILLDRYRVLARVVDGDGNSPLITHLDTCSSGDKLRIPDNQLIVKLLKHGGPVDAVNDAGLRAMDYAIKVGCLRSILLLRNYGAEPPRRDAHRTFEVRTVAGRESSTDFDGLLTAAWEWSRKLNKFSLDKSYTVADTLSNDASKILRETGSVYLTYLTLMAGYEVTIQGVKARKDARLGRPLLKLSNSLLYHLPPHTLEGMWFAIEWMSDHVESIRKSRQHFNEAEMMLLLNHPRSVGFDPDQLNPLTRALTATTRLIDEDVDTIGQAAAWNLARIGLYTHGFHLLLKHDSESAIVYRPGQGWVKQTDGVSLIQRRLDLVKLGPRPHTDRIFGPGYLRMAGSEEKVRAKLLRRSALGGIDSVPTNDQYQWYSLDSNTMLEFRRGYLLVSHPKQGTLVIRNSSLVFGRDTLRNVAYWSKIGYRSGYTYNDLLNITREHIQREMLPVLHHKVLDSTRATESVYFLLRQLDVVRDLNRRLKFDTEPSDAFTDDPKTGRKILSDTGGYRSPGFRDIVLFLKKRLDGLRLEREAVGAVSKVLPALAFARPWFPAWTTYRFEGEQGTWSPYLVVNSDVLEVLQAFVNESFTRRHLELDERFGVSRFFQEGFDRKAELVLVTPKGEPTEG